MKRFLPDLKLALAWNRFEDAKVFLFSKFASERVTLGQEFLDQILPYAIENNRVNFVKAFLNGRIDLQIFLTKDRLYELYYSVCNLMRFLSAVPFYFQN